MYFNFVPINKSNPDIFRVISALKIKETGGIFNIYSLSF